MELTQKQIDNFWSKVDRSDECWLWKGYVDKHGYGKKHVRPYGTQLSHRISYAIANGPISKIIMHKCDQPLCCRPDHLKEGTYKENTQDMLSKGRNRNQNTGKLVCTHGHELTGGNVYIMGKSNHRRCRACQSKIAYKNHVANKLFKASNYLFDNHNHLNQSKSYNYSMEEL